MTAQPFSHDQDDEANLALVTTLPTPASLDNPELAAAAQALRTSGKDPYSGTGAPEVLFISALLDSGQYVPEAWEVNPMVITGHRPVHAWCARYQESAGRAPTPEHVCKRFPGFPYLPGVSVRFAANELIRDYSAKQLRRAMGTAAQSIKEEALEEAVTTLREAIDTTHIGTMSYASIDDFGLIGEVGEGCPIPAGAEAEALGTHRPGHVWTVAARTNVGKSWDMVKHAVAALEGGWDVSFFSLEMPAGEVLDRVHRMVMRDVAMHWDDVDEHTRRKYVEAWAETAGQLRVYDKPVTPLLLRGMAREGTLVIVDHYGLMRGSDGQKASTDWRVLAGITAELKEVAMEKQVPILGANQLTRGAGAKPTLENLSGADTVGTDADVVMFQVEHSSRSRKKVVAKNRHGEKGMHWYTDFNPAFGQLGDITPDEAYERLVADEDQDL